MTLGSLNDPFADPMARAQELLDATVEWFPFAIDPTEVTTEGLALAGVARCRELLRGMVTLHDSPDLAGPLARTLYETWLSAIYLLLAEDEAYRRLESTDLSLLRKQSRRMLALAPTNTGRGLSPDTAARAQAVLDGALPSMGELNVHDMAVAVQRLLRDVGDPNADYPITMYAVHYGVESYTTTHGGLGALKNSTCSVETRSSTASWLFPRAIRGEQTTGST